MGVNLTQGAVEVSTDIGVTKVLFFLIFFLILKLPFRVKDQSSCSC